LQYKKQIPSSQGNLPPCYDRSNRSVAIGRLVRARARQHVHMAQGPPRAR
jgi:hypothetical protein